jgi:hypothetical protein
MSYSGFIASDVDELAARYGNATVNNQTKVRAPFYAEKVKRKHIRAKVGIVNVRTSGLASTRWLADGGALPSKSNKQPVQGVYLPRVNLTRVGLPRLAAALVDSVDDGVALVMENLAAAAEHMALNRGRGLIGSQLPSATATAAQSATTLLVASPAGYVIGGSVDSHNSSDAYLETITVSRIVVNLDGTATLTVSAIADSGGIGATHKLYQAGGQANAPAGLRDATAAASLYGVSNTTNDWEGNLDSATTELNIDAMRLLMVKHKRRRGKKPGVVLMNSMNEKRYSDLNINNRRFAPGQVMDATGGLKAEFDGVEVFVDECVGDEEIFYVDLDDVMVHEFVPLGTDGDGSNGKPTHGNTHALVDDTDFVFDVQMWEACNQRFLRRNGISRMSALAA